MSQIISTQECEKILADIDAKLAGTPFDGKPDLSFDECLRQLSKVGRMTWYRCDCGPISPEQGTVDILCDKCGQFRQVGPRLSRSPWPLYVACLRRVRPDDWFLWLKDWLTGHSLCAVTRGAYLGDSPNSAAGGEAYDGASHHSLAGATAPETIQCIDNMQISSDGTITGLNWIALPLPESAF